MANDRQAGTAVQGTAAGAGAEQRPVPAGQSVPGQSVPGQAGSAGVPKKRGRETAGDMLRSLGLVLVLVVALWFFAQPPDSDEQELRVVDPAVDVAAFAADVPQAPVPGALPETWRTTSSTYVGDPSGLRVGYVTPSGRYAEYAASTAAREEYLPEIAGEPSTRLDDVRAGGSTWQQYRDEDGSLSLVRSYGSTLVVVGTVRATASLAELETLVGALEVR